MSAKLIFYNLPKHGKSMNFCPLMLTGCKDCFLPKVCKGENDPTIAFRLTEVNRELRMSAIRERKGVHNGCR